MLKYGNDKPDLRNPIEIVDVSEHFVGSGFGLFARLVEGGSVVRAIPAPGAGARSRKFFDEMNDWARAQGFSGLGYINIKDGVPAGPIAKNHGEEETARLIAALGLGPNDGRLRDPVQQWLAPEAQRSGVPSHPCSDLTLHALGDVGSDGGR